MYIDKAMAEPREVFLYAFLAGDRFGNTAATARAALSIACALREPDAANVVPGDGEFGQNFSRALLAWAFPSPLWEEKRALNAATVDAWLRQVLDGKKAIYHASYEHATPIPRESDTYTDAVLAALAAVAWLERWDWTLTFQEFARARFGDVVDSSGFFSRFGGTVVSREETLSRIPPKKEPSHDSP